MKHQPVRKRDSGNPLRLMDCYIETGAGQRPDDDDDDPRKNIPKF
jgi:hypothetical protein